MLSIINNTYFFISRLNDENEIYISSADNVDAVSYGIRGALF